MGAFPFGGHGGFVRLRDYLYWAATSQKCRVQTGYFTMPDGEIIATTEVTAESGKHVIITDCHPDEFLCLASIGFYDRRLGIQWPGSSS